MTMVTVQEVLGLAIETDMQGLAHRVFWAITAGKVKTYEDARVLDHLEYDEEAVAHMIERNVLNIGKVKLFVATTKKRGAYAFYYSENVLEATALHQQIFKESPKRLTYAPHLLGKLFEVNEKIGEEILYFHRGKVVAYPYYVGHAWAGERLLNREVTTQIGYQ